MPTAKREIYCEVFGTPIPQGSVRVFGGRVVHANKKLAAWRSAIRNALQAVVRAPYAGPLYAYLVFYLPRPKTVKRDRPHVKPDLDKLVRACLDAGTGVAWGDDSQIVEIQATKCYSNEPKLKLYLKELN